MNIYTFRLLSALQGRAKLDTDCGWKWFEDVRSDSIRETDHKVFARCFAAKAGAQKHISHTRILEIYTHTESSHEHLLWRHWVVFTSATHAVVWEMAGGDADEKGGKVCRDGGLQLG